ncbi:hypothetical protein [Marinospirillum celere]|nr:hypothetical protein [Marinospirillum celere]
MTQGTREKDPNFKIDFQLHPNQALHKHQLFWLAALTPVAIGLLLNVKIFWGAGFDFSIDGFNHWVTNSKLTLGLMALGIPFGVMVGSFHRTLQTAEQIKLTQSSLRPVLNTSEGVDGDVFYYRIHNTGLGPALIKSASLQVLGSKRDFYNGSDLREWLDTVFKNYKVNILDCVSLNAGYVMQASSKEEIFKIAAKDFSSKTLLSNGCLRVFVEYEDMYGNCFKFPPDTIDQ